MNLSKEVLEILKREYKNELSEEEIIEEISNTEEYKEFVNKSLKL